MPLRRKPVMNSAKRRDLLKKLRQGGVPEKIADKFVNEINNIKAKGPVFLGCDENGRRYMGVPAVNKKTGKVLSAIIIEEKK